METAEHKALLSKGGSVDDKMAEILVQLGRLHSKIELLQQALDFKATGDGKLEARVDAVEKRSTELERQVNFWRGASAVVTVLGGTTLGYIVWWVQQLASKP